MQLVRWFFRDPTLPGRKFRVNGIGLQERMPPCVGHRPNGRPDYLFMVFYDPVHVLGVDGFLPRPAGSLVIWAPGQAQRYGRPDREWTHSWIHVAGGTVARLLERSRVPTNTVFPVAGPADKYLFDIHAELTTHAAPDTTVVLNCLENWIREIARALEGADAPAAPRELIDVKTYIDRHYTTPLRLQDLADLAGLSVPHLCSQFKRYFGFPIMAYVAHLRQRQAAALLRDTNLSVSQVAQAVGYRDIFHFSKIIKQRFGVSPSQLRKR